MKLMERVDRVFDAPIELVDRKLNIPADQAVPGNRHYDKYVAGIHWVEAGVPMCLGGAAAAVAGVEIGLSASIFSGMLAYLGVMKAIINYDEIKR